MSSETKLISLSQGQFAIVDAADFDWLNQWKWHAVKARQTGCFYAARNDRTVPERTRIIFMHLQIFGKPSSGRVVDHENTNSLDNRRSNLRECFQRQNSYNSRKHKNNTSGFKGVSWAKCADAWEAYVCPNRRKIYLGLFKSRVEAARAYDAAAKHHFGEFARLNFPENN